MGSFRPPLPTFLPRRLTFGDVPSAGTLVRKLRSFWLCLLPGFVLELSEGQDEEPVWACRKQGKCSQERRAFPRVSTEEMKCFPREAKDPRRFVIQQDQPEQGAVIKGTLVLVCYPHVPSQRPRIRVATHD